MASQILLKIIQKRVPKMKSTKSDNFLNIFNCSEKFQKGRPLILSPWPMFCKLFCLITLQASANLPRQKKQKKSSKPCLIHEKNNAKVMLFFHVAFFAFWSQFGEALGSKKALWRDTVPAQIFKFVKS